MKLIHINERPSALPAACAQVSGATTVLAASAAAHVSVGYVDVWSEVVAGTPQTQAQWALKRRSVAPNGLAVKDNAEIEMIFSDVRGVPPRGRPV